MRAQIAYRDNLGGLSIFISTISKYNNLTNQLVFLARRGRIEPSLAKPAPEREPGSPQIAVLAETQSEGELFDWIDGIAGAPPHQWTLYREP